MLLLRVHLLAQMTASWSSTLTIAHYRQLGGDGVDGDGEPLLLGDFAIVRVDVDVDVVVVAVVVVVAAAAGVAVVGFGGTHCLPS
jgi:hypothetical protein